MVRPRSTVPRLVKTWGLGPPRPPRCVMHIPPCDVYSCFCLRVRCSASPILLFFCSADACIVLLHSMWTPIFLFLCVSTVPAGLPSTKYVSVTPSHHPVWGRTATKSARHVSAIGRAPAPAAVLRAFFVVDSLAPHNTTFRHPASALLCQLLVILVGGGWS